MRNSETVILKMKHVCIVYGRNRAEAEKMMRDGADKAEVYRKTGCTVALWDINLEIPRGKIFVIIGLSGSGKSSFSSAAPVANKVPATSAIMSKITVKRFMSYLQCLFRPAKAVSFRFNDFQPFVYKLCLKVIINIISYHLIDNLQHVSNMFNITPYYPSTQPVFHEIAVTVGIIPEILLYLLLIAAVSFGIFRLERIGCSKR